MTTISNHQLGNEGLNPEGRISVKHCNIHYSQWLGLILSNGRNVVQKWKNKEPRDERGRQLGPWALGDTGWRLKACERRLAMTGSQSCVSHTLHIPCICGISLLSSTIKFMCKFQPIVPLATELKREAPDTPTVSVTVSTRSQSKEPKRKVKFGGPKQATELAIPPPPTTPIWGETLSRAKPWESCLLYLTKRGLYL